MQSRLPRNPLDPRRPRAVQRLQCPALEVVAASSVLVRVRLPAWVGVAGLLLEVPV